MSGGHWLGTNRSGTERLRMAKGDRTGNRKAREQRRQFKVPELGYYLIVTDTEGTERCFFTGLHQALPKKVRNKLVIKVVETKTRSMIDKCVELTAYALLYMGTSLMAFPYLLAHTVPVSVALFVLLFPHCQFCIFFHTSSRLPWNTSDPFYFHILAQTQSSMSRNPELPA